jgi:hypothetical protein
VVEAAFGGFDRLDGRRIRHLQQMVDRAWHMPSIAGRAHGAFAARLREYLGLLRPLYRALRAVSGATVLVDSSKAASHGLLLVATGEVHVRAVHLVRDSRAVAQSWHRERVRPEVHWQRATMPRYGPVRSAFEWNMMNLEAEALRSLPYHRIRYEDLVQAPREAVRAALVGVGLDPGGLEFIGKDVVRLGAAHTVSGNPSRFASGSVRIAPDTGWEKEMRREARMLVTALTWPLLVRYGYLSRSGRSGSGDGAVVDR